MEGLLPQSNDGQNLGPPPTLSATHSRVTRWISMPTQTAKPLAAFGFLTAIEDPTHGLFGGYLTLSTLGRPLEFHCTTPVLPSPAQEILYGASIRPYLFGELIGQTLLSKAQLPVVAVLTDTHEMLATQLWRDEPILWLRDGEKIALSAPTLGQTDSNRAQIQLGNLSLCGEAHGVWQADDIRDALQPLAKNIDLAEPFQRIADAIREAQRITEPADEVTNDSSEAA